MEEYQNQDSDLDFSFTSTTTDRTFSTSSARSSLALSFNGRLSSTPAPSRLSPHWSAISTASSLAPLSLSDLKLIRLVGRGNLGRVYHCKLRDHENSPSFALKVVDNNALTASKMRHVATEAEILSVLDHPFLPTLYAHLEASHYTCLLIDYCPNGDLQSVLFKQPSHRLPLLSVRFFVSEILVALEYLHSLGIIYRDLKPENVLIREDGHVMLSDFDLCFRSDTEPRLVTRRVEQKFRNSRKRNCFGYKQPKRMLEKTITEFVAEPTGAYSRSCVGTHEYLAPELVSGNCHGNGVDWWAFGVLIYELLYGVTPFKGSSKEGTLRNIASSRDVTFGERDKTGMAEANDLIKRLLVKDPRRRLGCFMGATDIKQHPFFSGIKWPLIRTYKPPELRGVAVKKAKSVGGHLSMPIRRRWLWKGVVSLIRRSKGSKRNLNSNNNYYCYSNGSVKVRRSA